MKVNSITPNYNYTKANQSPRFKGNFLINCDYDVENYLHTSIDKQKEINEFFKNYMSPGVNVVFDYTQHPNGGSFAPWNDDDFKLTSVPREYLFDKKFYITNAKAIEDDILDLMFNSCKEFIEKKVNTIKEVEDDYGLYNKLGKIFDYISKQEDYLKADSTKGRLPISYESKLNLFKDFIDNSNARRVYKELKKLYV